MKGLSRRTLLVLAAALLLIVAAVTTRLALDRGRPAAPSPAAAPDDSSVAIPAPPPALPPDNMQQLHDANLQIDMRMGSAVAEQRIEAARMAAAIGDLWRAETLLRAVLNAAPRDRQARMLLADNLNQQERLGEARALCGSLISEDPSDLQPYLDLQSIAVKEGRPAEGWKWLKQGMERCAQTAPNMIALAHRYYGLNDIGAARRALARGAAIAPADINVQLQTAILLFQRFQFDDSRTVLEKLLTEHPDAEPVYRLLASILIHPAYKHPDVARANTLLERAVSLDAKDPNVYKLAASTYRRMGLNRMAAEAYVAYLSLEPRNPGGRFGLGQVYEILGKKELAREQLRISRDLRTAEDRVAPLSSDVTQKPRSARAHDVLATAMESGGDLAGALREVQTAAGLAPGDSSIHAHFKRLYARLGWALPERGNHG